MVCMYACRRDTQAHRIKILFYFSGRSTECLSMLTADYVLGSVLSAFPQSDLFLRNWRQAV